jgi:hypothetical protein
VFKVSFRQVTWSGLSIKERVIWEIRLSKSKCTQRIRQYGKIVSLVSIYYYYCLNRRSVIFLYWRLSILFYLILYSFPILYFLAFNPKGKFASYISINLGQVVPGTIDGQLWYDKCAPQIRAPFPKAKPGLIFTERSRSLNY